MFNIKLKNIKYAAFASEETHCFESTVYMNGKRLCTVSNDGHGGPNNYYPIKGGLDGNRLDSAIFEIARSINPNTVRNYADLPKSSPHDFDPDGWKTETSTADTVFECLVGELLDNHLYLKDMKRALRKNVLFLTSEGLRQITKGRHDMKALLAHVADKHPEAPILNQLTESAALEIWRQAGR